MSVLEKGPVMRWLRLMKVIRIKCWSDGTAALIRGRDSRDLSLPREDTVKRWPSISQKEHSDQAPSCWQPDFTSGFKKSEKVKFCQLSHSVCSTLLWQPELTNTTLLAICNYPSAACSLFPTACSNMRLAPKGRGCIYFVNFTCLMSSIVPHIWEILSKQCQ